MPRKLIQDLKNLVHRYDEEKSKSFNTPPEKLFLDKDFCPVGLQTCDPAQQKCPDEHMNPIIYAQNGLRCYTKTALKRMPVEKETSPDVALRDFVVTATQLVNQINSQTTSAATEPAAQATLSGGQQPPQKDFMWWDFDNTRVYDVKRVLEVDLDDTDGKRILAHLMRDVVERNKTAPYVMELTNDQLHDIEKKAREIMIDHEGEGESVLVDAAAKLLT